MKSEPWFVDLEKIKKLPDKDLEKIMKENSAVKKRARQLGGGLGVILLTALATKLVSVVIRAFGEQDIANYFDTHEEYFIFMPQILFLGGYAVSVSLSKKAHAERENYYTAEAVLNKRKEFINTAEEYLPLNNN